MTFWAMDRFSREGTEATLMYLRQLEIRLKQIRFAFLVACSELKL